jgi:hypothetical protein
VLRVDRAGSDRHKEEPMKRFDFVVSLVSLICLPWACSPTSPSSRPVPRGTPGGTATPLYTLSGVVSEVTSTGLMPVEDADVNVATALSGAKTDKNGFYSIPGLAAAAFPIAVWVSKEGYDSTRTDVTITGDTRLDIQIGRRALHKVCGVVFETTSAGRTPIERAWVAESSEFHAGAWTDADGFFEFSGLYCCSNVLYVSKDGYKATSVAVTFDRDIRIEIELVRR